jgi:hypothetical protein
MAVSGSSAQGSPSGDKDVCSEMGPAASEPLHSVTQRALSPGPWARRSTLQRA